MSLEAIYQPFEDLDAGEMYEPSWTVRCSQLPVKAVVACGFASKRDAELGIEALNKTGVNWDAPEDMIVAQAKSLWDDPWEACNRIACENLRW